MLSPQRLKELKNIVTEDYSGGVRLTELVVDLMAPGRDWSYEEVFDLESSIKGSPGCGLKVLNYSWETLNREKTFIYTP